MGNSSVHSAAAGGKVAPFFRFPYLQQSPQLSSYLAERNIAIFSTDIDSRDFTMHKPEQVVNSVMTQLEKRARLLSSCMISIATRPRPCRNCSGS